MTDGIGRPLKLGLAAGVVLLMVVLVVSLLAGVGETVVGSSNTGNLGISMRVDALVSASAFHRQDDQTRGGGAAYPTYDLSGLQIVAHATTRLTAPGEPTLDFPPITDPQWVAGYSLTGKNNRAIPDFEGEFLAGLYVSAHEFEFEGFPLWRISWMARMGEGGDVTILDGSEEKTDGQLAELARLLGRDDQAALLVDWVRELQAAREGAPVGPITLAFEEAFLPAPEPTEPPPSIEVPVLVLVEPAVPVDSLDKLVILPEAIDLDHFTPLERLLSAGNGPMTVLLSPTRRMLIEVWDDGSPMSGTAIEIADWIILPTEGGGVVVTVSGSDGAYWVTANVMNGEEFEEASGVTRDA